MPTSAKVVSSSGNLPAELTTFLGRRRERTTIKKLLSEKRLITLTGFGGVGKTRLALRTARDVQRAFQHGVWFIELETLTDHSLLPHTVAKTLGLRMQPTSAMTDVLADYLHERNVLLLLDNCEHLVDSCAELVGHLLRRCPQLRVLATSREPLSVGGEAIVPVAPLSVPADDAGMSSSPAEHEALAMFLDRAQAVQPELTLSQDNRELLNAICRQLEGIPLALELAAVRLRGLSPTELLECMPGQLRLLNTGNRTAPDRQRTLHRCIEWSYELCTDEERELWARASVFTGGFDLGAVEGVCGGAGLPDTELLGHVLSLVDKSILTSEDHGGRTRYRMLELIRRYGIERLRETDRWTSFRRRHRAYYASLAAHSETKWPSTRQEGRMERLSREHPNLQAALDFSMTDPGEAEAGLDIAANLREHWIGTGTINEGAHWIERLLTAGPATDFITARALRTAAWLYILQGDLATAEQSIDRGTALAKTLDEHTRALMNQTRGMHAMFAGDMTLAIEESEKALGTFRGSNDYTQEISSLIVLQMAHGYAGNATQALDWYEVCLDVSLRTGDTWFRSYAMWNAAVLDWDRGETTRAIAVLREAVRIKRSLNDMYGLAVCMETLGCVTAAIDTERAATLLGIAAARWEAMGNPVTVIPVLGTPHIETENTLRRLIGDSEFDRAHEYGRTMTAADSIELALTDTVSPAGQMSSSTAPAVSFPAPSPLTTREHEVAKLVARGLSNKEIANTLVVAQRTAETHVEHILTKLGFNSRAQVASWLAGQEPWKP